DKTNNPSPNKNLKKTPDEDIGFHHHLAVFSQFRHQLVGRIIAEMELQLPPSPVPASFWTALLEPHRERPMKIESGRVGARGGNIPAEGVDYAIQELDIGVITSKVGILTKRKVKSFVDLSNDTQHILMVTIVAPLRTAGYKRWVYWKQVLV
ncbi:hypothetical protein M8C21_006610, partial [Ambrosia artemisiifolia]